MMRLLITILFFGICLYGLFRSGWIWNLRTSRRSGLYPPRGEGTLFDVRRLIVRGERELAIRLYCEIYHVSYPKATQAVDELAKTIQEKNREKE